MQRTEKKDTFTKKFDKKIREEETRLLRLMEEHEKQRCVIRCLCIKFFFLSLSRFLSWAVPRAGTVVELITSFSLLIPLL